MKKPNKRRERQIEMKRVVATWSNYDLGSVLRTHAPCVYIIGHAPGDVEALPMNEKGAIILEASRRLMHVESNTRRPAAAKRRTKKAKR